MADLPNVKQKITDVEVARDEPLTTSLHTNFGSSINYLLDTVSDHETRTSFLNQSKFSTGSVLTNFNKEFLASGNATTVVATTGIVPEDTKVVVLFSGTVQRETAPASFISTDTVGPDFDLEVRRNGVTLKTRTVAGDIRQNRGFSLSYLNFFDTNAAANTLNTYQLRIVNPSLGNVIFVSQSIRLIGRL